MMGFVDLLKSHKALSLRGQIEIISSMEGSIKWKSSEMKGFSLVEREKVIESEMHVDS